MNIIQQKRSVASVSQKQKNCPLCITSIDAKAKVCPNCKKNIGLHLLNIPALILTIISILLGWNSLKQSGLIDKIKTQTKVAESEGKDLKTQLSYFDPSYKSVTTGGYTDYVGTGTGYDTGTATGIVVVPGYD